MKDDDIGSCIFEYFLTIGFIVFLFLAFLIIVIVTTTIENIRMEERSNICLENGGISDNNNRYFCYIKEDNNYVTYKIVEINKEYILVK